MGGGTLLTIEGRYFGKLKKNVKVQVAGVSCTVESVGRVDDGDDGYVDTIKCITGPADPQKLAGDLFPGIFYYYIII